MAPHASTDPRYAQSAPEVERVPTSVYPSSAQASRAVAAEIADLIRDKAAKGENAVLGLATGSTPQAVYEELVRLHNEESLSFANVITFNLDEYFPMEPDSLQSYVRFMNEHLFDLVDTPAENVNIPGGTLDRDAVADYCRAYEEKIAAAGGIDLQILGIGRTGHIGFNEPGSSVDSPTRLITLDKVTRMDAASDFFGEWNVPRTAITMGVGTIMGARRVILMAYGEHKAPIVRHAVEGDINTHVSASYLQNHPNARFVLDPAAAAELTRFKTPWLLGSIDRFGMEWDEPTVKRAVLWLAETLEKPILKLTDEDYNEHGLQDLVTHADGAYEINIRVFKSVQKTITGWPGGKAGRPKFIPGKGVDSANGDDIFPKRAIVFSPHPDDDVISMGGTLIRLCDQRHDVHVAYQTSGNIAVFDDHVEMLADFVQEISRELKFGDGATKAEKVFTDVVDFIHTKQPGEVDIDAIQAIKGLIRRTEARAGAKYSGVPAANCHFLDLPFYETGTVKKAPIGERDIEITVDLLQKIRPHMIFAAGDLSDPHGTHRTCLAVVTTALHRLANEIWMNDCDVWLYRGAWQEWAPHEIDMAVPLSPSEVERKRMAIFKHQSQKDRALFPGPYDTREFWQRAEARNANSAKLYDALGLPEYQAIEGFVHWTPSDADQAMVEAKPAASERVVEA
ncbi:MAG: glucosamine-6-phosphate deaminase [Planctomycetota bacterium]